MPPHPLSDAFVFRQGDDGLDVFVRQLGHGDALVSAGDVVGQDHRGEHREAVRHVQRAVVVVVVDARQFLVRGGKKMMCDIRHVLIMFSATDVLHSCVLTHDLVSRLAVVHQVGQQDGVFGAREATGGDLTGTLLDGDSLVVLVHGLQEGGDWLIEPKSDKDLTNYHFRF